MMAPVMVTCSLYSMQNNPLPFLHATTATFMGLVFTQYLILFSIYVVLRRGGRALRMQRHCKKQQVPPMAAASGQSASATTANITDSLGAGLRSRGQRVKQNRAT
jgi:hypothetical protein